MWSIWSNGKNYEGELISQSWQQVALAGGTRGGVADQNLDAVITLFEVARRFSQRLPGAKPSLFIDQLLGEKILSDSITATAQRGEVVKVLTVHSAKGLEWPHVMLVGVNEGLLPFKMDEDNKESINAVVHAEGQLSRLQEERRLMYVGITRAQRTLAVSWSKRRKKGRETIAALPSRFIAEMALDKNTVKEDPREKLRALRAEFALKAAASEALSKG